MAKQSFPQIPASVWWGVRELLQKTPSLRLDPSILAAKLSVQEVAASQYVAELKRIGILDDEARPTPLAAKWRMDDSYSGAVDEIIRGIYPEGLVAISPPGEVDRGVVKNWFMQQGLGDGAANNKAATYALITSPEPREASRRSREVPGKGSGKKAVRNSTETPRGGAAKAGGSNRSNENGSNRVQGIPLNVNIQIHISADATSEQIETIFASMRKYLHDDG